MPNYAYACHTCGHKFEQYHLMSEPHPKKCPKCGEKKDDLFGQDYTQHNITCISYGNPTTIGQQAELNTKRLGREQHQKMVEGDFKQRKLKAPTGPKAETPWYRNGCIDGLPKLDKPLELSKIKDTKKYIETGEKS